MSTPEDQPVVDEGNVAPPEATQLPADTPQADAPADPNEPQPTQPIVVDPSDPNAPPVATQLPADVAPADPAQTPTDPDAPVATQPIAPPPDQQAPADQAPAEGEAPPSDAPADEAPAEVPVQEQPEGPGPDVPTQLPTIPISDESGSDIPPPNLVQPPTELPPAPSEGTPVDPALEDPAGAAQEAQEGGPNDAAARPDNEAQGDVDVATVPEASGGGQEYWAPITVEDWVILGASDLIPKRVRGRRAAIVSAPRIMIPVGQEGDIWLTVRVRDATNAMLMVPLSEVTLDRGGRESASA